MERLPIIKRMYRGLSADKGGKLTERRLSRRAAGCQNNARPRVFTLVNDLELSAKQRVKRAAGPRPPWDQSFRAAETRQEKRRSPLVSARRDAR